MIEKGAYFVCSFISHLIGDYTIDMSKSNRTKFMTFAVNLHINTGNVI